MLKSIENHILDRLVGWKEISFDRGLADQIFQQRIFSSNWWIVKNLPKRMEQYDDKDEPRVWSQRSRENRHYLMTSYILLVFSMEGICEIIIELKGN